MSSRCFLIALVFIMTLTPLSIASAEAVHQAVELNYGLFASPFLSSQYAYVPFDMRQKLDAHYFRFSGVASEDTIAYESLPPGSIFRSNVPKLVWAAESVYGFTWVSSSLQAFTLSPFGGVGYRAMGRDLSPYCCVPSEDSSWFYGTAGLRADWKVTSRFWVSPQIALRMPITVQSSMRTQNGDEVKLPFGRYIDAQLPMIYHLDRNWDAYIVGTVERVYVSSSPAEILSRGVPVSDLLGHSTERVSISFGFQLPF